MIEIYLYMYIIYIISTQPSPHNSSGASPVSLKFMNSDF